MLHACLTASCVAVPTHLLHQQQLGLPYAADAVKQGTVSFVTLCVSSPKRTYLTTPPRLENHPVVEAMSALKNIPRVNVFVRVVVRVVTHPTLGKGEADSKHFLSS